MQPQKNLAEEMTQLAARITTSLYEFISRSHLIRSGRSHVFRLDFSDGRGSKLLKIARAGSEGDVLREQQILPALHRRGFEVPCIEYTQEETDFDVPFTIMDFVEGGGMEKVGTSHPAMAQAAYARELTEIVQSVREGGGNGVMFYNYSESPMTTLNWIKPALAAVRT